MDRSFLKRFWTPAVRKTVQALWVGIVLVFLTWYLARHWAEFRRHDWHLDIGWAALAVFWALVRRLLGALRWALIARQDRSRLAWEGSWRDMRIYFLSNLAAYIPGSVWYMPVRIQQSARHGQSVVRTSVGLVFETGLLLWTGLMVGLIALDRILPVQPGLMVILAGVMVVLSLAATHPKVAGFVLKLAIRLLRRPVKPAAMRWSWGLAVWVFSLGVWVTWGLSLFCLLKALDPSVSWVHLTEITGAFALAWTIGFLTPWAPSGLGIREGLLFWLLDPYVASAVAVTAAVASRLVTLIEDLFWAGVSLVFKGEDASWKNGN